MSRVREEDRLSLAYKELDDIPEKIIEKYSHIRELDLSNNKIVELRHLRGFTRLETLVLDNNQITSHSRFPKLPTLLNLCVNSNQISNLSTFIENIVESLPNLKYLSMLRNEACPNYFNGGTPKSYDDYRHFVISQIKTLSHLDSTPVSDQERQAASRKYFDATPSALHPTARPRPKKATQTETAEKNEGEEPGKKKKKKKKGKKKTSTEESSAISLPPIDSTDQDTQPPPPPPSHHQPVAVEGVQLLPDLSQLETPPLPQKQQQQSQLLPPPPPGGGRIATDDDDDDDDWSSDEEDNISDSELSELLDELHNKEP